MRTERGQRGVGYDLVWYGRSELIAQHSVLYFALFILLFGHSVAAQAQQTQKLPRIGYLTVGSPETTPARFEAFQQGLREVGYTDNVLSLSSIAMQKTNSIDSLRWAPSS